MAYGAPPFTVYSCVMIAITAVGPTVICLTEPSKA